MQRVQVPSRTPEESKWLESQKLMFQILHNINEEQWSAVELVLYHADQLYEHERDYEADLAGKPGGEQKADVDPVSDEIERVLAQYTD